jgi:hypothetical protein
MEPALAAIAPVVALATVLQKKGILSMADLYRGGFRV